MPWKACGSGEIQKGILADAVRGRIVHEVSCSLAEEASGP